MKEKDKLKLISDDMYCHKYKMDCQDVPFEVLNNEIYELTGLGFSAYECDLMCNSCKEMELLDWI